MKKISALLGLTFLFVCTSSATLEARHCSSTNFAINVGGPVVCERPAPVYVRPAPVIVERRIAPAPVYVERAVPLRYVQPAVYERPAERVVVYEQPAYQEVAVYQAPVVVREPVIAPPLFSFSWNWFRR